MGRRFRSNDQVFQRRQRGKTTDRANVCLSSGVSPAVSRARGIGYRDWAHEDGVFHLFE